MAKIKVRNSKTAKFYVFWCQGCEQTHTFQVLSEGVPGETWTFNNDLEKPTFSPSLNYGRCHLFVRDGIIEYCDDCYHKYAGIKIPLVDF